MVTVTKHRDGTVSLRMGAAHAMDIYDALITQAGKYRDKLGKVDDAYSVYTDLASDILNGVWGT